MNKIRITYNQIEVLDIIESFRYLPIKVLRTIAKQKGLYSHRQSLEKAIIGMESKGLLKSFYYGNNWKVVYLTKKGGELLADVRGVELENISIPNQGQKVQFAMLEHSVKIGELYEQFVIGLKSFPHIQLNDWIGDQRMVLQYEFRSDKSGRTIKRVLSPDSYFEFTVDNKVFNYFLEYDTGSMDIEQLSRKFLRYFEYFVYGDWQKRFNQYPQILFLSERTKQRLDNLQIEPETDLQSAIDARGLLEKSKNLKWMSVGKCENIKSITSSEIESFLTMPILFNQLNESWVKDLLKQY
ncbi:replication-relaxation family protein [Candidatus Nomurabacteria bacterium]|nr:replication-relaxation family protein [Candidatus Nomurabacteria bacterium]